MEQRVREDLLTLACVRRLGPVGFRDALARADGVEGALAELPAEALRAAQARVHRLVHDASQCGAALVVQGEPGYPPALLDLEDAPAFLFTLGAPRYLAMPMVAIVGTREATSYGERIAARFARELTESGIIVVSGLARGIDSAAHRGALEAAGPTIGVVAGGVDLPSPTRHRELHATMVARGLVLSEQPCGFSPRPGAFPRRNRLIAALGAVTVVVEAGIKSGARLTASLAFDLGRPVGAVPGSIESTVSAGTHLLIRDGATPITSVDDILSLAQLSGTATRAARHPALLRPDLNDNPLGEALWNRLRREAATLDALVAETERPPREVLRALTALEVAGLVRTDVSLYAAI